MIKFPFAKMMLSDAIMKKENVTILNFDQPQTGGGGGVVVVVVVVEGGSGT